MNKKYLTIGAAIAIIVVAAIAYFYFDERGACGRVLSPTASEGCRNKWFNALYFPKKTIDLPTENLAIQQTTNEERPTTTTATPQNAAVGIKDRTLKKDGFTILVPAGWAEVNYMAGATIIANPSEENLDSVLKKSGFKSYFSVTREKMREKTWEQAVAYVETIVNGSAPEIKYSKQENGNTLGIVSHYWEADLTRDGAKFKVLVYAVRGKGDDLWILTFNTGASMWPAYARLTPKVFDSFGLL